MNKKAGEWVNGIWQPTNPPISADEGLKRYMELQELYYEQAAIRKKVKEMNKRFRSIAQKKGEILRR